MTRSLRTSPNPEGLSAAMGAPAFHDGQIGNTREGRRGGIDRRIGGQKDEGGPAQL